jgi:hypothetical protein
MGRVRRPERDGHAADPVHEEQIIGILRQHQAVAKTARTGDQQCDVLQMEGQYVCSLNKRQDQRLAVSTECV